MTRIQLLPVARRWRFVAAAAGITALAGGGVLLAAPSDPATALAFHTVPTVRVLDTRPATQVGTRSTPLGLGDSFDLVIPGLPDDATGVNINVTAVDGTEGSFLTVYPTGDVRPTTSTVNWEGAGAVANNATVVVHRRSLGDDLQPEGHRQRGGRPARLLRAFSLGRRAGGTGGTCRAAGDLPVMTVLLVPTAWTAPSVQRVRRGRRGRAAAGSTRPGGCRRYGTARTLGPSDPTISPPPTPGMPDPPKR